MLDVEIRGATKIFDEAPKDVGCISAYLTFHDAQRNVVFCPIQHLMNARGPGKDFISALLQRFVVEMDARSAALIAETWHVETQVLDRTKLPDQLKDHPGATECLTVQFFTPSGDWLARAEICAGRVLGPWKINKPEKSEGRFTNIFMKARALKKGEN